MGVSAGAQRLLLQKDISHMPLGSRWYIIFLKKSVNQTPLTWRWVPCWAGIIKIICNWHWPNCCFHWKEKCGCAFLVHWSHIVLSDIFLGVALLFSGKVLCHTHSWWWYVSWLLKPINSSSFMLGIGPEISESIREIYKAAKLCSCRPSSHFLGVTIIIGSHCLGGSQCCPHPEE